MWQRIRSFWAAALGRARFEDEMDSELRGHMDAYTADLIRKGVPAGEAAQRARREFGQVHSIKDECREARGLWWADELRRDFRYALRLLRRSPAFTLAAIATLALCIGANTAVFSVVDAVLFRPMPYPKPDRLASIATLRRGRGTDYEQLGQDGRGCETVRVHSKTLDAAVFGDASGVNLLTGSNNVQYVHQHRVSAGYFRVLGVSPVMGREFSEAEDRAGGPKLAILSDELWRRVFGADSGIIGRNIALRGEPHSVIGVMPPGFRNIVPADLWTPLHPSLTGEGGGTNYALFARLRSNVSWERADAELASISQSVPWRLSPGQTAKLHLLPLRDLLTERVRKPLLILWTAVGLVLLIGCVNIASLLLARSGARAREIATRMAIGSGRGAVIRQLLAESLLLAVGAAMAGTALGYFALGGLKFLASGPFGLARTAIALDGRVLTVTAATAIATGLLFGLYPAIATTRVDIRTALASGGSRGASGHHGSWGRQLLVVAEVTLSLVLLISAGLLIRTFARLTALEPGFDSRNVMTASLSLQDARYATAEKMNRLYEASLERIRRIPGVESAGVGLTLPYERALNEGFRILDGPRAGSEPGLTNLTYVTPGYFEALRMTLLRGRVFTPADRAGSQHVAIVNQAFARRYLAGQDPAGSHLALGSDCEVVGVIGDVQQAAGWGNYGPVGPVPGVYIPAAQLGDRGLPQLHTWFSPSWVVRTAQPFAAITGGLRDAVASVDPQLPFAGFQTMDQVRFQALAMQRLNAILIGILAALALLLAAVGIYGLIAQSVVERTRELGIRMALGASLGQSVRAVSASGMVLALAGLAAGCFAALGVSRILRTLLWGIAPNDPVTFAGACGTLLVVIAVASVLPCLRIARIDPAQTLREE